MAISKSMQLLANKLGLAEDSKVLSKAAEFERLLQAKSTARNTLTDTSKVVICLDLAATLYGADLDQKLTVKYSGLKAPSYKNNRKVVENLLELNNDKLSVSALCLSMQCSGMQDLAENILQEFQRTAKMELDMTLPQYVCMAVYQACRINKVKIPKSKIIEKSRVKPAQWTKLEAEWTKIVNEKFASVKKRGQQPKIFVNDENAMEIDTSPKQERSVEPKIEPYEDWKGRMLDEAYRELKEIENGRKRKIEMKEIEGEKRRSFHEEEVVITRRSPRKTPQKTPQKSPQKLTPFKSPRTPSGGIRLLFPK